MRGIKYHYNLYMMGVKEPYVLSEEDGVALTEQIAKGNIGKLIVLKGGDIILNVSSFSHLVREADKRPVINQWNGKVISYEEEGGELTPGEIEAREKYKMIRSSLSKRTKMLSDKERTKAQEEAAKEERRIHSWSYPPKNLTNKIIGV